MSITASAAGDEEGGEPPETPAPVPALSALTPESFEQAKPVRHPGKPDMRLYIVKHSEHGTGVFGGRKGRFVIPCSHDIKSVEIPEVFSGTNHEFWEVLMTDGTVKVYSGLTGIASCIAVMKQGERIIRYLSPKALLIMITGCHSSHTIRFVDWSGETADCHITRSEIQERLTFRTASFSNDGVKIALAFSGAEEDKVVFALVDVTAKTVVRASFPGHELVRSEP